MLKETTCANLWCSGHGQHKMFRVMKKAKVKNDKVRDRINIKFGAVVMVGVPGMMEGDAVQVGNAEGFDYQITLLFV